MGFGSGGSGNLGEGQGQNYWENGQERESEEREQDVRGPRAKVSSWPTED